MRLLPSKKNEAAKPKYEVRFGPTGALMGRKKEVRRQAPSRATPPPLARVLRDLRNFYGPPEPPKVTDPFEQILWENVAYLADDERREEAFEMLRQSVGTKPEEILAAPRAKLLRVARHGILPEKFAEKLRASARIALTEFGGDLRRAVKLPLPEAKKALRKFPGIGEPGTEKILLFSRSYPLLALDSNGLRVLLRLGFGKEEKSYAASYRSAQEAVRGKLPDGFDALIEARELLRRHGQELCRRTNPACEECPLNDRCLFYKSLRSRRGGLRSD